MIPTSRRPQETSERPRLDQARIGVAKTMTPIASPNHHRPKIDGPSDAPSMSTALVLAMSAPTAGPTAAP